MAFTNDVRLIGFCGTMPQLKRTHDGRSMCFLPIYTDHWAYTQKERKIYKELHTCIFSGRNAARAVKLLMKGSQVMIRGSIHYHKIDRNGHQEIKPQIIVEDFMITTKATVTKELYDYIFNDDSTDTTRADNR